MITPTSLGAPPLNAGVLRLVARLARQMETTGLDVRTAVEHAECTATLARHGVYLFSLAGYPADVRPSTTRERTPA